MRTTASYDLFPDAPSERAMARARWLARGGPVGGAERAHRDVPAAPPQLKPRWAQDFVLLRGVRRDGGRSRAAEVALEGAAQAAEHKERRDAAEREIAVTRRFAFYAPRKPEDLAPGERWFAEGGAPVLAAAPADAAPGD